MGEAMGLKIILPARGAACISSSSANSIKGNVRTLVYDKRPHTTPKDAGCELRAPWTIYHDLSGAGTADLHFRPKNRRCGRCGLWFTTCQQYRYYGKCCRKFWREVTPEVREVKAVTRGGRTK